MTFRWGVDMDGAVILGAELMAECVTEVLREEEPFRHDASSIASRGGRGRDFDGGVSRVPFENARSPAEEILSPAGTIGKRVKEEGECGKGAGNLGFEIPEPYEGRDNDAEYD